MLSDSGDGPPRLLGRPLAYHQYILTTDQNGRAFCGQCLKTLATIIIVQELSGQQPAAGVYCEPCAEQYGEWQREGIIRA